MSSNEAQIPFRWDLVTPDQLGSLLDGVESPRLAWLDEFVECAGKVVARSGGGQLVFVGRSLDSMFDLLSGAFADVGHPRVSRFPVSFARDGRYKNGSWTHPRLTEQERQQARALLASIGAHPRDLARLDRPLAFVDVVHAGSTFGDVYTLVRDWIEDERAPWSVIRKKLRFVGVTSREKTSPNTWRWHQHAPWTAELPSSAILNVSLDPYAWSYFGNHQTKLHRTYRPKDWTVDVDEPRRDEEDPRGARRSRRRRPVRAKSRRAASPGARNVQRASLIRGLAAHAHHAPEPERCKLTNQSNGLRVS